MRKRPPTIVRDDVVLHVEVNTRLEDCILTGIAVYANPSRGVRGALSGGCLGRRKSEGTGNSSPCCLNTYVDDE